VTTDNDTDDTERYWAECTTCDRVLTEEDGTVDGHDRAVDALSEHIDDGSACHGGRVMADGPRGERRVL